MRKIFTIQRRTISAYVTQPHWSLWAAAATTCLASNRTSQHQHHSDHGRGTIRGAERARGVPAYRRSFLVHSLQGAPGSNHRCTRLIRSGSDFLISHGRLWSPFLRDSRQDPLAWTWDVEMASILPSIEMCLSSRQIGQYTEQHSCPLLMIHFICNVETLLFLWLNV